MCTESGTPPGERKPTGRAAERHHLLDNLVAHIRRVGWAQKAFLGVFAEVGTEGFYERYEFGDWGDLRECTRWCGKRMRSEIRL